MGKSHLSCWMDAKLNPLITQNVNHTSPVSTFMTTQWWEEEMRFPFLKHLVQVWLKQQHKNWLAREMRHRRIQSVWLHINVLLTCYVIWSSAAEESTVNTALITKIKHEIRSTVAIRLCYNHKLTSSSFIKRTTTERKFWIT